MGREVEVLAYIDVLVYAIGIGRLEVELRVLLWLKGWLVKRSFYHDWCNVVVWLVL